MTKLDELIEQYTAKGAGFIPGVVLNVIDKQGIASCSFCFSIT